MPVVGHPRRGSEETFDLVIDESRGLDTSPSINVITLKNAWTVPDGVKETDELYMDPHVNPHQYTP